ncbi:MAG TPA: DegT/DnrJ/EryC1/StrS family aminotransferase [Vicinamibacterales bacterium]|nr:DegT/DnrJ/EryC1/StrS family aminotransferase [Vicinamibacterales bacterium]
MSATETPHTIPVARPQLGEREVDAVRRVILSGWVTQGPEVAAFEREFAAYVGAPHACAVSNCTTALHLALLAVGVQPGDEVITVSHSFIATANAIRYCGADPVFVDIDPDTYNIDPALIEPAITSKTRAILCVHQLGMPCDLAAILEIGRRHGLPVVEDAACAIGSEILFDGRWETIGKPHGDIACFSFHPRKVMTTGDGGMLTTANPAYDAKFRLWRQHSMSVPDTVRHGTREVIFESYPELGFNYRLTDLQAAIGREQLRRLPELIATRRRLADRYRALLAHVPGLRLPLEPVWARSNWQSYCVRLPEGADQRAVMQAMLDAGVSTRRGVMCAHLEPAYERPAVLPRSEDAQASAIILPLFADMTPDDQETICRRLEAVLLPVASRS